MTEPTSTPSQFALAVSNATFQAFIGSYGGGKTYALIFRIIPAGAGNVFNKFNIFYKTKV